ncbi:MAG: hypothetical protein ACI9F9_000268 [Candidatus Paceibacteria bacterium]|jgi:hypothetical protein
MRNILTKLSTLLLALAAGCATGQLPSGTAIGETLEARETNRFAVVDASPTEFFNRTLLVEAKVIQVCKKAGCWMQIEDGGQTAMVRWESGCGGKFKFPQDALGKNILIQGSFYPKELSQEDREHIREEAGGDMQIREDPYEFNASAVMILESK